VTKRSSAEALLERAVHGQEQEIPKRLPGRAVDLRDLAGDQLSQRGVTQLEPPERAVELLAQRVAAQQVFDDRGDRALVDRGVRWNRAERAG